MEARRTPRLAHVERIATLEAREEHVKARMDAFDARLGKVESMLQDFHDLLLKARGINWFVVKVLLAVGGFAGFVAALLAAFGTVLRIFTGR
jgi:hypothetical protein